MGAKGRSALLHRRDLAQAVGKKTQRALRCNARVQLAHSTGCSVARVNEGFFAFFTRRNAFALAFIQGLKVVAAHIDLATHFQHCRH